MSQEISHLIINSPYEKPQKHWEYDREKRFFKLVDARRSAGYLSASGTTSFDDPGIFHELPLVNMIRKRIDEWRENNYAGVTGMTRKLLEHWKSPQERDNKFFFCQLEAIETLIWLREVSIDKEGIDIPSDGGPFQRLCAKMATGTGKTIVMGMLIAWQTLNKIAYPNDSRFSKIFLVVAPGLTVKKRLQVLKPTDANSIYNEFNIVPTTLYDNLRQATVIVHNWHVLMPLEENPRSVVKKGTESDVAFARRTLDATDIKRNIVVINDEAHHAWRTRPDAKFDVSKEDLEEATRWMEGLDKIHKATGGIITCYDFSATPFVPTGKNISEETLYEWVVSDFSLNDAIESGLVKTPRVAIRDDGRFSKDYHSKFYHIYADPEVKSDINRRAKPEESLPDLIKNAYFVLGKDWLEAKKLWEEKKSQIPPVMITVCNRTETAARIEYSFRNRRFEIEQLDDAGKMLHIDSSVLERAESVESDNIEDDNGETRLTMQERAELLREQVATVGKVGKPGQNIQNIVAVQMLSEGWDARNVTHIMGLRAFTSQLLCEQVVGRGLRRTSYEVNPETGLFEPEYVNVFGIPFTFLPAEGSSKAVPLPPKPTTCIEPYVSKKQYEITWPNVIRIDRTYLPKLSIDWSRVEPLVINPEETSMIVDLAPVIDGKPHVDKISTIEIEGLGKKFRLQTSIFKITRDIYERFKPDWKGNKEYLLFQLVKLVEEFVRSDKLDIGNRLFEEELRRRVLISLNMNKIVQHVWSAIIFQNIESVALVFDREKPIRTTGDMMPWYTSKANEYTKRSHISHAVVDSRWELAAVFELERNESVKAWVKNDHLGFDIAYVYDGIVHKYWPDFLIRRKNDDMLVLEIKGQDTEKDRTKRRYLDEWVKAVNEDGHFGKWSWDVAYEQSDVRRIIKKHTEIADN